MRGGRWHIRARVMVTLVALTAALLLAVSLVFNLSVRSYIQTRVARQLDDIAVDEAADDPSRDSRGRRPPQRRRDQDIGTSGSAVVLSGDGQLLSADREEESVGKELGAYFSSRPLNEAIEREIVTLDSGTYALTVVADPSREDAYRVCYVDVTAIMSLTDRVNHLLLLIILAAILLSALVSRHLANSFARPVKTLSAFAQEIGQGRLEPRDIAFRDVEFTQLLDAMNQMARELSRADQRQKTFFQNVSHELRTPLTAIRGNAEGIVCGLMEPTAAGQVILAESDRLGGMVEDILYLSRMGRETPQGKPAPLDLREVLSLCVSEQRRQAEDRGVAFRFQFDPSPVLLPMREEDAHRLFGNLISNAIRYARAEITLSCAGEENRITVSVADDGPGISPADLPHIFERFYKGAGGRHGIGLSIVQSVTETYGGTVAVENRGGALFTLTFPRT